jgi:APA family basic amino acid/polyamine antiporter
VIYAAVGITVLAAVPVDAIASSDAPLGLVVDTSQLDWLSPIVRIGAGIAALGVLLNLIPGVSRTVLAMARRAELPRWFATIDNRRSIPLRAETFVTAIVIVLTATLDLRGAIGFSAFTILTYYAITNAACLTLPRHRRRWPRTIGVMGFAGCVTLAVMLPVAAVLAGAGVLAAGILIRQLVPSPSAGLVPEDGPETDRWNRNGRNTRGRR